MYTLPTVKELRALTDNDNHKFTVVSTFAGGGGSSAGYRMAGGKVLLVNEFVGEARRTYQANWPKTIIIPDDIRKITGARILNLIGLKPLELDIFDGSPPCSAFSTSGKREKGWGDHIKKYSDVAQSNIEDLFFEYIRLLRDITPKCFVAENVAGLAVGIAKGYLNEILRALRGCDYHVEAKILDAKWLGVPQTRNRIIIIGVHNSIFKKCMIGALHPKPSTKFVTLKEALIGLNLSNEDRVQTDIKKYSVYQLLKNLKAGEQHKTRFNLIKASPEKPCDCITATTGNKGAASPKHWENRAFSVDEIKRIMSIPDDYIITGTYEQKIERLGRMVPPLMMKHIAENLFEKLLKHEYT